MTDAHDRTPDPDVPLVPVFRPRDAGVLPLAQMALEHEGIEYTVRKAGWSDVFGARRPSPGSDATDTPVEVLVREPDADRARTALADLDQARGGAASGSIAPERVERDATTGPARPFSTVVSQPSVELFDAATGQPVATVTGDQLRALSEHLELESLEDQDFYLTRSTLDMLEAAGADTGLLGRLRQALAERDEITVQWR